MNSKTQYRIIAVLICIVIYAIYISLSVSMDWGHGGGYLVLVILVGILRVVWKGVTNLADEEDKTNETPTTPQEDILPEIPVDAEEEPLPAEEVIPIPIEETDESIPQEDNEDLPPIPDIEEDRTTIVAPTEEPEMFNQQPKTHWKKFRLYYIIAVALCVVAAVTIPITVHVYRLNKIEKLLKTANDAYEKSFYDLAISYSLNALEVDSNHLAANYLAGMAYYHNSDEICAEKHFSRAYALNPNKENYIIGNDTNSYAVLLFFYTISVLENNPSRGLQLAQEYVYTYPDDYMGCRNMLYAYKYLKNNSKALEWAKKYVEHCPDWYDSYFCLATIFYQMEHFSEAICNYKKSILLNGNASNLDSYINLGCCYAYINKMHNAYKCWRLAYELGDCEYATANLRADNQPIVTNKIWLYDRLTKLGYRLGTKDEYLASLSSPENIDWYYEKASKHNLGVGTKDEFMKLLLLK